MSCWSLQLSLWLCDRGVLPHTVLLRRVEKLWELVIRWSLSMTKLFALRPIVGVFVVDLEPSFPLSGGQHLEASHAELSWEVPFGHDSAQSSLMIYKSDRFYVKLLAMRNIVFIIWSVITNLVNCILFIVEEFWLNCCWMNSLIVKEFLYVFGNLVNEKINKKWIEVMFFVDVKVRLTFIYSERLWQLMWADAIILSPVNCQTWNSWTARIPSTLS